MGTFTDMTDEEIDARIEFANFTQSLEEGDPALATMVTRLAEITGYYQGLPDRKTSHLDIYITEHMSRVYGAYVPMKGRKGQYGLDMIVPPGFDRDSYPIMVSSGEHVKVTPASQTTNTDNRSMLQGATLNINEPVARETVFDWIEEWMTG